MRVNAFFISGLLLSVLLHAGLLGWLWSLPQPVPRVASGAPEMMVSMLAPEPMAASTPSAPLPVAVAPVPSKPLAEISKPVMTKTAVKPASSVMQQAVTSTEHSAETVSTTPVATTPGEQSLQMVAATHEANYLHNPKPVYPSFSRRMGEEGRVVLRVHVSAEGVPLMVELKQSSGFSRLDDAALETASRWRFVPARRGEEAVVSWVEIPVQFSLDKK